MKIKNILIMFIFMTIVLVGCNRNYKFGMDIKDYSNIISIESEGARVKKDILSKNFKDKVQKLINNLNESNFEKVSYESLKGNSPTIIFDNFTFEVSKKHIRIIKEDNKYQYNSKVKVDSLIELHNLLNDELGI